MDQQPDPTDGPTPAVDDDPVDAGGTGGAGDDPLLMVRARLDEVDQLPLDDRAEVFEQTHRVVVDELRALELG